MTIPAFVPDQAFGTLDRPKPQAVREVDPEIISLPSLLGRDLEPPRWIIDKILPEGLAMVVSPPKTGKSFLVGAVAIAAASGGIAFNALRGFQCGVLFLDLEQSQFFAQARWNQLLYGQTPPRDLRTAFRWNRMDRGGLQQLERTLAKHPDIRLVIVDVLSQFWPMGGGSNRNANAYHVEYQILVQLRDFAEAHRIALLLVHHTNKTKGTDQLDRASGTNAMTGVPGASWDLSRERKAKTGKLYITGRSVVEMELEMVWNPFAGGWNVATQTREEAMPV